MPPPAIYCPVGAETHPTQIFNLLQPLAGDFQSNDVTSGSLPVA